MVNKSKEQESIDNTEIVKMIIAMQEKSSTKKGDGISVSPMVAVSALLGIVVVLVQVVLGIGMYSIKDKLERYDAYEARITQMETTAIKFENSVDDLKDLIDDFDDFAEKPRFSADDGKVLASRINDNSQLIRSMQANQQRIAIKLDNEIGDLDDYKQSVTDEQTRQWTRMNDLKSAIINNGKQQGIDVNIPNDTLR